MSVNLSAALRAGAKLVPLLAAYVGSKSYLDFGTKTLNPVTGFWVNKP